MDQREPREQVLLVDQDQPARHLVDRRRPAETPLGGGGRDSTARRAVGADHERYRSRSTPRPATSGAPSGAGQDLPDQRVAGYGAAVRPFPARLPGQADLSATPQVAYPDPARNRHKVSKLAAGSGRERIAFRQPASASQGPNHAGNKKRPSRIRTCAHGSGECANLGPSPVQMLVSKQFWSTAGRVSCGRRSELQLALGPAPRIRWQAGRLAASRVPTAAGSSGYAPRPA